MVGNRTEVVDVRSDAGMSDPLEGDPRVATYFGAAWPAVSRFAALLREQGVRRGLLGPNEAGRLWERHLLNSAGACALLPATGVLADLGSGGGLPGVVLAAMRPEAHVVLLEPMERRTDWLTFVVSELGLANARVIRGRAEDVAGTLVVDAMTARAVSSLDNLLRWAAPLVRTGGQLFAIKGARAGEEAAAAGGSTRQYGWVELGVIEAGTLPDVQVARIVRATRGGSSHVR